MRTDLPSRPEDLADLKRRMTATIVAHGSSVVGVIPALQRLYTGAEIAYGMDAAKAAAHIILREPSPRPDTHATQLAWALAGLAAANPDLCREVA